MQQQTVDAVKNVFKCHGSTPLLTEFFGSPNISSLHRFLTDETSKPLLSHSLGNHNYAAESLRKLLSVLVLEDKEHDDIKTKALIGDLLSLPEAAGGILFLYADPFFHPTVVEAITYADRDQLKASLKKEINKDPGGIMYRMCKCPPDDIYNVVRLLDDLSLHDEIRLLILNREGTTIVDYAETGLYEPEPSFLKTLEFLRDNPKYHELLSEFLNPEDEKIKDKLCSTVAGRGSFESKFSFIDLTRGFLDDQSRIHIAQICMGWYGHDDQQRLEPYQIGIIGSRISTVLTKELEKLGQAVPNPDENPEEYIAFAKVVSYTHLIARKIDDCSLLYEGCISPLLIDTMKSHILPNVEDGHDSPWQNCAAQLADLNTTDALEVKDAVRAFIEQVVLGALLPLNKDSDTPAKNLKEFELRFIREQMQGVVFQFLSQDKSLTEMAALSHRYTSQSSLLDDKIRVIPRKGNWHSLMVDQRTFIPEGPATGWSVSQITSGRELVNTGRLMGTCIGGKVPDCNNGRYHVFVFKDPEDIPRATLRVEISNGDEGLSIDGRTEKLLEMDFTNYNNIRNFSPEENAAYQFLVKGIADGSISLQLRDIGTIRGADKENDISPLEEVVGYTRFKSDELGFEDGWERAYAYWAQPRNTYAMDPPGPLHEFDERSLKDSWQRTNAARIKLRNRTKLPRVSGLPDIRVNRKTIIPDSYRDLGVQKVLEQSGLIGKLREIIAKSHPDLFPNLARKVPTADPS